MLAFRMFDLSQPLPFSQGHAIRAIAKQHRGKVIAAGECTNTHEPGTLLYVKLQAANTAEFVALDDGTQLIPKHIRIEGRDWHTHDGNQFQPDPNLQIVV